MPEPITSCSPSNRLAVLESIARTLLRGALADPAEDLGAWVAGVEIVEALNLAGFCIVRRKAMSPEAGPVPGVGEGRHQRNRRTGPAPRGRLRRGLADIQRRLRPRAG